ncbi:2,4-dienoyl-CoA reductase [Rhizoctonia solani AG-1 IA]|uniref:2,4-dienoyl-CoA reductase [(3E)-enoyl-CoA-producing] n=1 Tax=Thanatephorus cucumeris (strain AG1-IA) TaxID=983506 RepID=L8WJJ7_THACA|nr:2,4-dienoyl-CoA reductase [Rhizoctonia solani AG-1 IA]
MKEGLPSYQYPATMTPTPSKTVYVANYIPSTSTFKDNIFDGKVLFCTGGGSGICRGMVEAMRLTLTASELSASTGRQCIPAQADVRSPEQLRTAVDTTISKFGRIDFVICGSSTSLFVFNAFNQKFYSQEQLGTFCRNELGAHLQLIVHSWEHTTRLKRLYHMFESNMDHTSWSLQHIITEEWLGRWADVAQTHLDPRFIGIVTQAHMSAAKAGVDALSRVLAVEEGPRGVRSNVIAPGKSDGTEGMDRLGAKISDKDKKALGLMVTSDIPLQRTGHIGDIANATIFLFSNAASWITGQTLAVDGGSLHTDGYLLPYPTGILDPGSVERMIRPKL